MHRTAISIGVVKLLPNRVKFCYMRSYKLTKDSKKDGQVNQVWVPTGDRAMEKFFESLKIKCDQIFLT